MMLHHLLKPKSAAQSSTSARVGLLKIQFEPVPVIAVKLTCLSYVLSLIEESGSSRFMVEEDSTSSKT